MARGGLGTRGSSCGTWGCVGLQARKRERTQGRKTAWLKARSLTTQVDGVEEDQAGVRGQAVQQLRDLVVGLLRHPGVDELRIDITVVSQDCGSAAIEVLRGIHKGVSYGQVWGAGGRWREGGMSPLNILSLLGAGYERERVSYRSQLAAANAAGWSRGPARSSYTGGPEKASPELKAGPIRGPCCLPLPCGCSSAK